jgi:hypothetical protein
MVQQIQKREADPYTLVADLLKRLLK